MKVLITGVSATGKSSVCRELRDIGYAAFDPDDDLGIAGWYDRKTGRPAEPMEGSGSDWVKKNKFVWHEEELETLLNKSSKPVFVCGVVDKQFKNIKPFDKVFFLHLAPTQLEYRLANRDTKDFGKEEDEKAGVMAWQPEFDKEMLSVGAIPIDSSGSAKGTVEKILKTLENN